MAAKKKKPAIPFFKKLDNKENACRAFIERIFIIKLAALRQLSKHIGLIGQDIDDKEFQRRIDKHGIEYIYFCLLILNNKSAHPTQHAAAGALLECFIPEWKDIIPLEFVGLVAKRRDKEVRIWRNAVLKRDNYICVKCGDKNRIEVHHIVRWVDAPSLRLNIENGMTLCVSCHNKEHGKKTHT